MDAPKRRFVCEQQAKYPWWSKGSKGDKKTPSAGSSAASASGIDKDNNQDWRLLPFLVLPHKTPRSYLPQSEISRALILRALSCSKMSARETKCISAVNTLPPERLGLLNTARA